MDDMDDDNIDIEEHDLMENPAIRKMFPDLTVIKKEISAYYEEDILSPVNVPPEPVCNESEIKIPDLICDENQTQAIKLETNNLNVADSETTFSQTNLIILGTKPIKKLQILKKVKLLIEDQSCYLNNCKRYCKECLILFPNASSFDLHIKQSHPCKTSESITNINSNMTSVKRYKCDVCSLILSSKGNLMRHFKRIHRIVRKQDRRRTVHKSQPVHNEMVKLDAGHSCFHCGTLFPSQKSLIDHLYETLDPNLSKKSTTKNEGNSKNTSLPPSPDQDNIINTEDLKKVSRQLSTKCTDDRSKTVDETNKYGPLKKITTKRVKPLKLSLNHIKIKKMRLLQEKDDIDDEKSDSVILKHHKCEKCAEKFISKRNLDHHIQTSHMEQTNEQKESYETNKLTDLKQEDNLYQCQICSRYIFTLKKYAEHIMTNHNVNIVDQINSITFDPQCKFCSAKSYTIKSYNIHLSKNHKDLLGKTANAQTERSYVSLKNKNSIRNQPNFICKSILFKCTKCDIHFLLANDAKNHLEHTNLLINWQCLICQRIFKERDKRLHERQHTLSNSFTSYALFEDELDRVLYKCLNCAIHFNESSYLVHCKKCDSEIPSSLYCNICDILVHSTDMNFHDSQHKQNKLSSFDFTIIETEIFFVSLELTKKSSVSTNKSIAISFDSLQTPNNKIFTFCHNCKCFISNVASKRSAHVEKTCALIPKAVCKYCGLLLTMKGYYGTHTLFHEKNKGVTLHDYVFYDFKLNKLISPPLPCYPNCTNCGVHFLTKSAVQQHLCNKQDYVICRFCNIKLIDKAFQLHMPFHEYKIPQVVYQKNKLISHIDIEDITILDDSEELNNLNKSIENTIHQKESSEINTNSDLCVRVKMSVQEPSFLYICESCQISVSSYQRVVQHCQDHYDCDKSEPCMLECKDCPLKFDPECYEHHKLLHLKPNYNEGYYKVINFDPFYFRYSNTFWKKHIFAYVADEQIKNILENTIYQFECRLKMELIQSGQYRLYKCDKCKKFIDPCFLYIHAESSCNELNKYPCSFCKFIFDSPSYREAHQKVHDDPNINHKSFEIVLYNKKEHNEFNKYMFESRNMFAIHQCRNCDAVIDKFNRANHQCNFTNLKKCSTCGLILNVQDYELHFIRHEELERFKSQFMVVLLFGKVNYSVFKAMKPSFTGIIHHLIFYKCKHCKFCFNSKENATEHVCISDMEKNICDRCDLYFTKKDWKEHVALHTNICEFDKYNVNLLETAPIKTPNVEVKAKKMKSEIKTYLNKTLRAPVQLAVANNDAKTVEKLFKCKCGLHFLEELNAQQHSNRCNPKLKVSRQNCVKCHLMFTPGELFNHLLKHHCEKKSQLSFTIEVVSQK